MTFAKRSQAQDGRSVQAAIYGTGSRRGSSLYSSCCYVATAAAEFLEGFTVVHLLGDPIGTIAGLLRKIDGCQSRAVFWQDRLSNKLAAMGDQKSKQEKERLWKSLAIIIDSYDEWGLDVGNDAEKYLSKELYVTVNCYLMDVRG
jgi:hypothetical protein